MCIRVRGSLHLHQSIRDMQEGCDQRVSHNPVVVGRAVHNKPELQQRVFSIHRAFCSRSSYILEGFVVAALGKATSLSAPAHVSSYAVHVWSNVYDIHEPVLLITFTACGLTSEASCCRSSACWHRYFRSCSCRSLVMA